MIKIFKTNKIKLVTLILLLILIFSRIAVRIHNDFWTDELEEVRNLTSVKHLLLEYLPRIPGGSPGHYLLVLPINNVFPSNKYMLGFPGLVSHILVFLLIPIIIGKLSIVQKKDITNITQIVRIAFVLDPTYIFQSMEVRPYSILPLLWIFSVLLVSSLFENIQKNHLNDRLSFRKIVFPIVGIILVNIWHYYGILMIISIALYYLFRLKNIDIRKILYLSFSLLVPFIFALPLFIYFSPGSNMFDFDTFEMLKLGFGRWQNYLYGIIFIGVFASLLWKKLITKELFRFIILLVGFPILIIFILDLHNRYWFLLRQFAWTLLPLYTAISMIIYNYIKNRKLRYFN